MLAELAANSDFRNHQYYCRGVAKNDFSEIAKKCQFVVIATYVQHGLNTAFQKKPLVLANIAIFDHEASRGPHMSSRVEMRVSQKFINLSIQKVTFCREKLKTNIAKMHLTLHTATQSENHYFFFDGEKHQNQ